MKRNDLKIQEVLIELLEMENADRVEGYTRRLMYMAWRFHKQFDKNYVRSNSPILILNCFIFPHRFHAFSIWSNV